MSPNPGFENHLFISYAHIDNDHVPEVLKGWIDLFHEGLETRLKQLLGRPVKIWRDKKLNGSDIFNEVIADELAKTALLVSVVSPRYLDSPSCTDELENFIKFADASAGLQVGNKYRIIKAVKTPVPLQKQPPTFREMLGYEFYVVVDPATNRFREYDYLIGPNIDRDKRFWDKVDELAQEISGLLQEIADQKTVEPTGATIYLAETTIDLSPERDRVKRELLQSGHRVLPNKPLPAKAQGLTEAVREYLAQSSLSIHMVGEFYDTVLGLQHNLAIERGADPEFSRLIWMPPALEPADTYQQKFVNDLRKSANSGSDLLETKIEDLKTIIAGKLAAAQKPVAAEPDEAPAPSIYLICDKADKEAVKPLFNYLVFETGFNVTLSLPDARSEKSPQFHKDHLMSCDGVLLFFGNVGDLWWPSQLAELRKIKGYGRTKPLVRAVYIAPPRTDEKELLETRDPLIIKGLDGFNADSLDQFVSQIKAVKGGQA